MARQARARKAVLWGLVSFLGTQLGIAAVIAWGPWAFLHDAAYGYKAVLLKGRLAGKEHPYTAVFLGSSRTMWSVDTAALEPILAEKLQCPVVAFNFAHTARGPVSHEIYLRRLLQQGLRPDLLFIEIHPLFLAGQVPQLDLDEVWMPTRWLWRNELSLLRSYAGPVRSGLRRAWVECWALPAYGHRITLLNYVAPQLLPQGFAHGTFQQFDAWGFPPHRRDLSISQQPRAAIENALRQYKSYCQDFRVGDAQCTALRHIAELCQEQGITAVWLVSPEGPIFRSWYPPGAHEQVLNFVASLAERFGNPIIDATKWFTEDDFVDSHHLTCQAGRRYTERLGREAILPLVSRHAVLHASATRRSRPGQ